MTEHRTGMNKMTDLTHRMKVSDLVSVFKLLLGRHDKSVLEVCLCQWASGRIISAPNQHPYNLF